VVDLSPYVRLAVLLVCYRRELVCVPEEIDVKRWDKGGLALFHELQEFKVAGNKVWQPAVILSQGQNPIHKSLFSKLPLRAVP
jgi:hypothetical protein